MVLLRGSSIRLTLGLRPGFPLLFLEDLLLLFTSLSVFSGAVICESTFTLPPLFLESSSGWIRGRTPPFDMVTPLSSCTIPHQNTSDILSWKAYCCYSVSHICYLCMYVYSITVIKNKTPVSLNVLDIQLIIIDCLAYTLHDILSILFFI